MMTESSWLYPVYDAIAAIALIPEEKRKQIMNNINKQGERNRGW